MASENSTPAIAESLQRPCAEIAGRRGIAAACECGESVYSTRPEGYDLLLIMEDYADGLRYHTRRMNDRPAMVLAADKSLIDLDAQKGAMGCDRVRTFCLSMIATTNSATEHDRKAIDTTTSRYIDVTWAVSSDQFAATVLGRSMTTQSMGESDCESPDQ